MTCSFFRIDLKTWQWQCTAVPAYGENADRVLQPPSCSKIPKPAIDTYGSSISSREESPPASSRFSSSLPSATAYYASPICRKFLVLVSLQLKRGARRAGYIILIYSVQWGGVISHLHARLFSLTATLYPSLFLYFGTASEWKSVEEWVLEVEILGYRYDQEAGSVFSHVTFFSTEFFFILLHPAIIFFVQV